MNTFSHVVLVGPDAGPVPRERVRRVLRGSDIRADLTVLESADPDRIRALEAHVDFARVLFVVSQDAADTLGLRVLLGYFTGRVRALVGDREAGRRFIFMTDLLDRRVAGGQKQDITLFAPRFADALPA